MSRQILPCWAAHSRMGHNVLYGYAEPFAGTSIVLTVPAIDGDDQHGPLVEEVHVLPMEGPAFYGFEVLTEDTVRARVSAKRLWKPRALLTDTTDAVEVAEDPALDCKPIGTLLREFTADDLDDLPVGSTFGPDPHDDTLVKDADGWHFDSSPAYGTDPGAADPNRPLTRIGPAPIVQAAPISSDVRPAAAVGQRVFVGWIDRLTPDGSGPARTGGWYLVTEGAPIVVERLTGQSGDLAVPTVRYVLTLTEWEQNVSTVLDANGHTLFDEVPF